jgi:hypothetical protein
VGNPQGHPSARIALRFCYRFDFLAIRVHVLWNHNGQYPRWRPDEGQKATRRELPLHSNDTPQWDTRYSAGFTETDFFYKVGHHGSYSAALREKGLELMPHGLVAFISVDHEMAAKKHWGQMPLPGLMMALKGRGPLFA